MQSSQFLVTTFGKIISSMTSKKQEEKQKHESYDAVPFLEEDEI